MLGAAGEFLGLALHEDLSGLTRLVHSPVDAEEGGAALLSLHGAVLSLGFDSREFVAKSMRDEIKKAKWPIASQAAYPFITAVNTPGAGITVRQLQAVTVALTAVLGFVEKHGPAVRGEVDARFPLRYTDKATGASIEMPDAI